MSQVQLQSLDWTLIVIGLVDVMVVTTIAIMISKLLGPRG